MIELASAVAAAPTGPVCAVIIGAGPAGLKLGQELKQRGVEFVILEKREIGHSWTKMPTNLKLVSPWKCNHLDASGRSRFPSNAEVSRSDFLNYLRDFASAYQLPVLTNCDVASVRNSASGFTVETTRGTFQPTIVVNATGYFSAPVIPSVPGDGTTRIPRLHYSDFSNTDEFVGRMGKGSEVLVVGSRLSAGQLAVELHEAGFRVSLSHRTPIQFGVGDFLWPIVRRVFPYAEAVRLRLHLNDKTSIHVPMQGGRARQLLGRGAVKAVSGLARFESDNVVFTDGSIGKPSLVIYATGFSPQLAHLRELGLDICPTTGVPRTKEMESVTVPNLFFLGLESLRNFQSRFLRGIRKDAVVLADTIAKRLAQMQVAVESPAA